MKIFKNPLLILSLCVILLSSCSDDDTEDILLTESDRIVGTWTLSKSVVLGITVPGDGSTLTFNECTATCAGIDFQASDDTSGTFTYELTSNNTILSIIDNDSSAGGAYSGDWTISSFTNNSITLSASTFIGNVSFTFTK